MADRHELIEEAKKQLDNLSAELDSLEVKLKDLSGEAKKKYQEQAADLRVMLQEAERKFDDARNASDETWEEMKGYVELTGKALKNSFNYFLSHYKKK